MSKSRPELKSRRALCFAEIRENDVAYVGCERGDKRMQNWARSLTPRSAPFRALGCDGGKMCERDRVLCGRRKSPSFARGRSAHGGGECLDPQAPGLGLALPHQLG